MKSKQGQQQHRVLVDYTDWTASTGTMWCVLCQGEPVHIRKQHTLKTETKYLPSTYSQRGSAERFARKLNELFDTTDFTVAEVTAKTPY